MPAADGKNSLLIGKVYAILRYMENYSGSLDHSFHALADPTRRAVLHQLARTGPKTVKELAEPFDMGLPSFMKHISVLERSGLIESEKVGRVRTCKAKPERLHETEAWLSKQLELWHGQIDRLAEYVERGFD